MGANVARVNVGWGMSVHGLPALQDPDLGPSAPWNDAQLLYLKDACQQARQIRDDFRLLVMFDGIPSWVDGVSRNGHFTYTQAGWEQYAVAVVHVLNVLREECAYIELGNEVNQVMWVPKRDSANNLIPENGMDGNPASRENPPRKWVKDEALPGGGKWVIRDPENPHAGDIPCEIYAQMAAYAIEKVDTCALTRDPVTGLPTQQVLVGGLAIRGGDDSWVDGLKPINASNVNYTVVLQTYINIYLYILCPSDSVKRERMQNRWALSVHLYPRLGNGEDPIHNGSGDLTASAAMKFIKDEYDLFAYYTGSRDLWNDEFGISSAKIGHSEKKEFHRQMWLFAHQKRAKLKGSVYFGFTDLDPMMGDSASPYYEMGVITSDGTTRKPSGNQVVSSWSSLWT